MHAYRQIAGKLKQLSSQRDKKQSEYNLLAERLQEEKTKTANDHEEEKHQKQLMIDQCMKEIAKLGEQEKFKIKDNAMYRQAIEHDERELGEKRFEVKNVERLITGQLTDIENLKKSEKDRIYRFGPHMGNLVADIRRHYEQKRFKCMPKGPIGMEVEIRDPKYAIAVEQCIGAFMSSFVCENYQDERLLHTLVTKHIKE